MIRQSTRRRALIKVVALIERIIVERIVNKIDTSLLMVWFICAFGMTYALLGVGQAIPQVLVWGWVVASLGVFVPLFILGTGWAVEKVKKPRLIGNRNVPVELYWKICETLEQRGVTDAKRYLQEHPAHNQALIKLVYGAPFGRLKDWLGIAALIYLMDEDPEGIRAAIVSLIEERGDMPVREYRALLEIRVETSSALTSGAL